MDPTSWHHAKDVIAEALKRPAWDREAFVRSRCPDPALADEIVAIIVQQTEDGPAPSELEEDVAFDPGTRIGPYVILDHLGRGGMGEVFLGNDPRLQRRVALKCVIRSLASSGEQRVRVLHEARATARVNHPNVATVHDIIEIGDRAFIVMEYVEGDSLSARLKRGLLPIDQVIDIGRQLASALAAAHARGVVHRDLKPANVQLTPEGRVKILDFGIANAPRVTRTASPASPTADETRATVVRLGQPGTPPYMAPEQLLGRTVDARADVYSLGVVLYEMAVGERPFPGGDPLSIILGQANGAPRANVANARVPSALADIIARALAADPGGRFASATDVGAALETLARERERNREPFARRLARISVAAAAAISAIGMTGLVVTAGFNNTFGRTGDLARFGVEPWTEYFRWGMLGAFPSLFIMTLAAATALALRLIWRLVEAVGPISRRSRRVRDAVRRALAASHLERAAAQAQILAALAMASLVAVLWYFRDLVLAITSLFNSSPIAQLLPMRGYNRNYYEVTLDVLILGFGYGLVRVWRRRAPDEGYASMALLAAVVVVMVLMAQWPYRTLNYRDFPRVALDGQRCYVTGKTEDEYLVLCPSASPPRNRVASQTVVGRPGDVENVFTGIE